MQVDLSTKTKSDISKIGWYQIIGGGLGILIILYSLITLDQIAGLTIIIYAFMFVFFGYSVTCGTLCLKSHKNALRHSLINQLLQLVSLTIFGFAFSFVAGVYLSLGLDFSKSIEITFEFGISKFDFNINREHERTAVGLNLVALGLIYWINKLIKNSQAKRQNIIIASVGQS